MWPITEMCASVARAGAVRVRIASGRPSQPERSVGDRGRDLAADVLEHADELRLDHQQPPVAGAGVLAGGIADRVDQPLAATQTGEDPGGDLRVSVGDQSVHVIP